MSDDRGNIDEQIEQRAPSALAKMPASMGAIAVREQAGGFVRPTTMAEAYAFAQAVVGAGLAPDSYKGDAKKVMLGVLSAMEAGLPPLYGLRQIAIINGRPSIWGDAAQALIQQSGKLRTQTRATLGTSFDIDRTVREEWPDDYGFEVRMWRVGQDDPYIGRFTVGDAKRAKLWMNTRKVPWFEHPNRMLFVRARAFPQRDGFADALAGLSIREEVEDHALPEERHAAADTSFLDDEPSPPALTQHQPVDDTSFLDDRDTEPTRNTEAPEEGEL